MSRRQTLADVDLTALKHEVAAELATFPDHILSEDAYRRHLERRKFEVARELGIPLQPGYNGDLTARQAGTIGGHVGGVIGGHMVRRMIRLAEEQLARGADLPRA